MAKRQVPIKQSKLVVRFGTRLRELRNSRGMTQAELGRKAKLTASYIYRLESALIAPGIDLVERLAEALGSKISDLLPENDVVDTTPLLLDQANTLFNQLMKMASKEDLLMICPLLSRLAESPTRKR